MEREKEDITKKMQYILNMRAVLNKDAMFSDGSKYYRTPTEPDPGEKVKISFRTQRNNVDSVFLVSGEKRYRMKVYKTQKGFDYYGTRITMPDEVFRYYFEIHYGWMTCYYNSHGVSMDIHEREEFEIYPGYHTPEWAKGAVMYQIFVDRFRNGDPSNDVETGEYFYINGQTERVEDWSKTPAVMGVREFYGGDLQGIKDKLDYLQNLGVEVLYLNPIFVSPSNHKYDCQDYDYVDPHYGKIVEDGGDLLHPGDENNARAGKYIRRVTDRRNLEESNRFFARTGGGDPQKRHADHSGRSIQPLRILQQMDGQGADLRGRGRLRPRSAYVAADSPYRSYFDFRDENGWPYNTSYDGWWTHDTLPKLNYEGSRELYDHILEVGKKWVSPPYSADGWRLDVAADLGHTNEFNHQFWKDFRRAVKEANPEALILAEHYGNPESWLRGDEWDSVMNYDAFMEPVTWFLTGMEKHSDEYREDLYGNSGAFISAMKNHMRSLHMSALDTAMNELSNHDHSRFLTRTNRTVGRVTYRRPEEAAENINVAVMREADGHSDDMAGSAHPVLRRRSGRLRIYRPGQQEDISLGPGGSGPACRFHKKMIAIHRKYRILTDRFREVPLE